MPGGLPARAQASALSLPSALAYDAAGNLYIADAGRHQVFEATLAGTLVLIAGTGVQGFSGDGGAATAAELNSPRGVAVGSDGTVYIADSGNARIRAVAGGLITTFAGTGQHGFGGDGVSPADASFRSPAALVFDAGGGLLICDTADQRVRRVGPGAGGLVSTVAGTGAQGFSGDGGPATLAQLDSPAGLAATADGRILIADTHNERVRSVSAAGTISTFAGNGQRGGAGDGGPATAAQLAGPRGLAFTTAGALLIADADNQRVRQVSADGTITTLGGSGTEGASAEGAAAPTAALRLPGGLVLSPFGMPAFADTLNGTVRVITPAGTLFQPGALAAGRAASTLQTALTSAQAGSQAYGPVDASVTVSGAVGTAQGVVTLSDETGTVVATASLSGGLAVLDAPPLPAGAHTLTLAYTGDGLNLAANAGAVPLQVNPLAVTATAMDASMVYGAALPVLTGSVQGVLAQDAAQVTAVFSATAGTLAPVGSYPLTATLTGPRSANYVVSMAPSSGALRVTPAGSTTTLAGVAQGYAGLPLRLTANVAPGTRGQPTGTVQFLDAGTPVATGVLVNGSASAVYAAPGAGAHSLTAAYSGDGNFLPSLSGSELATVGALPDFGVSLAGPGSATVLAGNTAMYNLVVNAQPAPFTGEVVFAVVGLPKGATAAFSPVAVVPGLGAVSVTLAIQVPAAQASLRPGRQREIQLGCTLLVCGLIFRRRAYARGGIVCLSLGCFLLAGCGARTVGESGGALSSVSYPLQITGTSTDLTGAVVTHGTNLTLIVQQ